MSLRPHLLLCMPEHGYVRVPLSKVLFFSISQGYLKYNPVIFVLCSSSARCLGVGNVRPWPDSICVGTCACVDAVVIWVKELRSFGRFLQ
jgi:hypothetical protein